MKVINEQGEFNWGMIILLLLNASYWVCVYYFGFFLPTIWTIVGASIVGIFLRVTDRA